jgi:hypothetical protein
VDEEEDSVTVGIDEVTRCRKSYSGGKRDERWKNALEQADS